MGRQARHIYQDQAGIDQLERLIDELPTNGHVLLTMKDGSAVDGFVSERPNVQLFRGPDQQEGINAVVHLERPDLANWSRTLWLDEIQHVEHLDSTLGSES